MSSELGALAMPHLPKFFPLILRTLTMSFDSSEEANKQRILFQISCLSSLRVVITHLCKFLSPYYIAIIQAVVDPQVVSTTNQKILEQARAILTILAQNAAARVLIDPITNSYREMLKKNNNTKSFVLLFDLFGQICKHIPPEAMEVEHKRAFKFFLEAFDFRVKKANMEQDQSWRLSLTSPLPSFNWP